MFKILNIKKINLKSFKNNKFIFALFSIFIITISFLLWKNIDDKRFEEEKTDNIKQERILLEEELKKAEEIEIKKEELKREEIEVRGEEETVYGELGDFWIEIDTDDLKIKAPIFEGISGTNKNKDNNILDKGVGHHTTTAFPNGESGNVVLSGHRWFPGDLPARTVFIDLDKLKVNDRVRLYFDGEEFVYRITGQKVIKDTETYILDQTEKATITIYTCTPKYPLVTPTDRLVYFGELVK